MTVELYYALKDAKGPEERNLYRQIYQQRYPELYEFRNANFHQYRFCQRREDVDNQDINHEEPKRIIIREEEYEEEDVLTVTDINGSGDSETHLWTLTKEQYNAFNMEVQKDKEQELEVEDDDKWHMKETLKDFTAKKH